jgi:hypothetical protein
MTVTMSRCASRLVILLGLAAGAFHAAPALAQAPKPIETSDGDTPGTRVEVTELKRGSGGVVSLKFQMINDSAKTISFGFDFGAADVGNADFKTIGGITLVDPVAKKKYFVVRDTEKKCVCSSGLEEVPKGSRLNLWAKFPAPPEDVNKIGILIPHFAPMDDVPISK